MKGKQAFQAYTSICTYPPSRRSRSSRRLAITVTPIALTPSRFQPKCISGHPGEMHRVSSLGDQDIIRPFRYPGDILVVFLLGLPVHLFQEVPKSK